MPFDAPPRACLPRGKGALAAACLAAALAPALASCEDPTRDAIIDQLGDEAPGVPIGPLHRPGQPCTVCHDGDVARKIAVGGTVFWTLQSTSAAPAAQITVTDHRGAHQLMVSNCAGNFFLFPEQMAVQYPFWISMTDGSAEISMDSPVNGDGSCAKCHGTELSTTSTGRVYLYENPPGPPPKDCL